MSRSRFQDRLERIGKTRAVARHELQRQPDQHRGEHAEDRAFDPIFDYLEMALVGVMAVWLALDFWTALPYFLGCLVALFALHVMRLVYRAVVGSPRRKRHAIADLACYVYDSLTFW